MTDKNFHMDTSQAERCNSGESRRDIVMELGLSGEVENVGMGMSPDELSQ